MILAKQQYSNLSCYTTPITTTILLQTFCTATSDTAISHNDPHTDTTICYDTKPLIIQKSICYDDTIITAKLPIRYSYWDSNLSCYYSLPSTAISLLWSYRYNNTPTIIPVSKQQYAMLRFSHYYSNLPAIFPGCCYHYTHEYRYLIIYHVLSLQYNSISAFNLKYILYYQLSQHGIPAHLY
jgi:hypothetical protein